MLKRVSFVKLLTVFVLLISWVFLTFFLAGCSERIDTKNKVEAQLKIELLFPSELYETFNLKNSGTKIFAFSDELPISKYKVTLKTNDGTVIYDNVFTTSNMQFTVYTTPGTHTLEVKAYTNSSLYNAETEIMSKRTSVNIVAGSNSFQVPLEFLNGQIKVNVSLDSSVPSDMVIRSSRLKLRNAAKSLLMESNNTTVNSRTDVYTVGNVYPGVWDLEYYAEIFRNSVKVGEINKNFSIVVYPSRLTSCDLLTDVTLIPNVNISITAILPYIPPVWNIRITTQSGNLTITYDYNIENAQYRIYKKYRNENYWRFVGSTNQKTYTFVLLPGELDKIELVGVNVIVNNLESGMATKDTPLDPTLFPGVLGRVVDAVSGAPLESVRVSIMSDGTEINYGLTDSTGNFTVLILSQGTYTIKFSKSDYLTENYYNVTVQGTDKANLGVIKMIRNSSPYSSTGNIGGSILDAVTGNGVGNAQIKLRSGINNRDGTVAYSVTTSSNGRYQINNVQAGYYTAEVSAAGYITSFFTVISIGGTLTDNQNFAISPNLAQGKIRIVLTWGAEPQDLDSHFTGPMPDNTRFHVCYYNQVVYLNETEIYAELDRDDVDSYGPETVTLHKQLNGTYSYYVHDYSNRDNPTSSTLSNSGAEVRVYSGETLLRSFTVPGGKIGTVWHVFDIVNGTLVPKNQFYPDSSSINAVIKEKNK